MAWILVVLIVGAMAYAAMIIVEYTNYTLQVRPRIAKLDRTAAELEEEWNGEEARVHEIELRSKGLQDCVSGLQRRTAELRGEVKGERDRKQRLEMEVFKRRLKGGRRMVAA
jgi:chromosome segregation ATPase